jgi:hypothetical protein
MQIVMIFHLFFLQCDAFGSQDHNHHDRASSSSSSSSHNHRHHNQATRRDCRAYSDDGKLTLANRYSLNSWSHVHIDGNYSNAGVCTGICHDYNNSQMFDRFVTAVNSQSSYNQDGIIRAIPIIVYHGLITYPDVSYSKIPVETSVDLFDSEMKYLHDNGFKVITMSDIGYDENSNNLYVKTVNRW